MKPLKLSDLNTVLPYLDKANYEGYNSNFVTMMMWNHEYHIEYEIHDHFCIMLHNYKGHRFFAMPFASCEYYKEAVEYMVNYAKENKFPFMIDCAIPSFVEELKKVCPGQFVYEHTRDLDDYVYDKEKLITLSGKKMQKMRNNYHNFISQYPNYEYRTLNADDDMPMIFSDLLKWGVGRDVQLQVDKKPANPGEVVLDVENVTMHNAQHKKDAVRNVSFQVHAGEIVCLAGIEGNGQTEFVYGLTGLEKISSGKITLDGKNITNESIRQRSKDGMSHIPEDRHKHGLVLDYSLENNMVLQRYWQPEFQKGGFIRSDKVREYSDKLIAQYDVRSGQGSVTTVRSMSGGNQQKAIIAREIDKDPKLLVAVQPTRGLDVGAIEYIHRQIVAERDKGTAVLLVSLELDEVMNLSDRILVMYEGEVVGEFDPKTTTVQELGLYMAGARKQGKESK